MGFLSRLLKSDSPGLVHLPAGSFTLDRHGRVMTSTLPQSFPVEHLKSIGEHVLNTFRGARKAQLPLSEIVVQYAALKLLARELRGGAIIFLTPQVLSPEIKKA